MTEYQNGELLFKDGDWELRNYFADPDMRTRIWHYCDEVWWYVWLTNPQCCKCKKYAPTELVGLKILHDWDR